MKNYKLSTFVNIGIICTLLSSSFLLMSRKFYNDSRLKELSTAINIIESIEVANTSSENGYCEEYTDIFNIPIYKICVYKGKVKIKENNGHTDIKDFEILIAAIENLPHFAIKYSEFLCDNTTNDIKAAQLLINILKLSNSNGNSKNQSNNETN